jgi:hypothetical protein
MGIISTSPSVLLLSQNRHLETTNIKNLMYDTAMCNKMGHNLKTILVTLPWQNSGTKDLYGGAWGSHLGDFI